ncbi:MAG: hypothetical protein SXA11_03010 [Cyanobacteriota bacterium]|nr:hypothetical protein [Cyanobacteriota bacterium]
MFFSVVYFQIGSPTESSRWIYEAKNIKLRISDSIDKPKLIVVAGSNGLFGISCHLIQKETKFPCINGSTIVALQIDYMLDLARRLSSEEDIVLLALEYETYKYSGQVSSVLVDYVFAREPDYISSQNLIRKIRLFGGMSLDRIAQGIIAKYKPLTKSKYGYQSNSINDYGDETNNRAADLTEYDRQKIAGEKPLKSLLEGGYFTSTTGMNIIEEFVDWCRQNNIKVIATWPNTIWFEEYISLETEKYFQSIKDFYQSIDVPILGEPRDFMYDPSLFYDTIYHLNDRGTRRRTQKLIELLLPYLDKL